MWRVFNKPYPFNEDLKQNAKIIFFASIGVFIFLFLFQPLEIGTLPVKEKYYLMVGIAIVTFLSLSFNLLVVPSLFTKKFSSSSWNVKKEILWDLWILFTTLVGYFIVNKYLGVTKVGFSFIIKLLLMAVVPISALIVVNHNKMLRSHLKLANELSKKLKENKSILDKIVYFNSDYQKDSLAIKASLLLLIRSANNYIEVFWKENQIIKNQMIRCSMIYAEEILKEYKFIFKCHRSYIVNINYIDKIEGNSQGYKLFFENINFPIPVSKNSVVKLRELI
ncbi:MAG: LytTR family transcriptional regulator DNA-binding domain-containing protein [Bacteroidales bacterium]